MKVASTVCNRFDQLSLLKTFILKVLNFSTGENLHCGQKLEVLNSSISSTLNPPFLKSLRIPFPLTVQSSSIKITSLLWVLQTNAVTSGVRCDVLLCDGGIWQGWQWLNKCCKLHKLLWFCRLLQRIRHVIDYRISKFHNFYLWGSFQNFNLMKYDHWKTRLQRVHLEGIVLFWVDLFFSLVPLSKDLK